MSRLFKKCKQKIGNVVAHNQTQNKIKKYFTRQPGCATIFSIHGLTVVIALVTLFLQIISFMTTWQGAEVYLGGIFLFAPLLFALAVQSIVYFLSNSLRNRISVLRIFSLAIAICCSTYFSYIGIYNTVNSPRQYLQDRYGEIHQNLTVLYEQQSSSVVSGFKDSVNELVNGIQNQYANNSSKLVDLESCQIELDKASSTVSKKISAPNKNSYAKYEDYVAAYNAYLSSVSSNSTTEYTANMDQILSKYGYTDKQTYIQDLNSVRSTQQTLENTVQNLVLKISPNAVPTDFATNMNTVSNAVYAVLENSTMDNAEFEKIATILSELVNLHDGESTSDELLKEIKRLSTQLIGSDKPVMRTLDQIEQTLPFTENANQNMLNLKAQLDSEIQTAITRINNILIDATQHLSAQDDAYIIHDSYVLPIKNLTNPKTSAMAILCLTLAALVDLLTVLFAMILKRHSSILSVKKVSDVVHGGEELFGEQVLSSLMFSEDRSGSNDVEQLVQRLYTFVRKFQTTEVALNQGYSLCAPSEDLDEYAVLLSLLAQLNYIKIIPKEYYDILQHAPYNFKEIEGQPALLQDGTMVLLKSKFILWVNQKFSRYISIDGGAL